jgi:hypothetical protein
VNYTGEHFTKNGEIKIYHHVIDELQGVKLSSFGVYLRLLGEFDGTNNGDLVAPLSKSRAMFNVCPATLSKALNELEKQGLITATKATGRTPKFITLVDYL